MFGRAFVISLRPFSLFFSVSLRVNGRTVVSALSDTGGHNPVSQSALQFLNVGDVAQLEVIK